MSSPPIPVHPNVKLPGTTVDVESSPVASVSLVPLPRNLKEAVPATFTWLWGDKSADGERWVPFRRSDQPRLDAAETNFQKGKGAKDFVQVEGGRWKVSLRERTLRDSYGSDPPKKDCRVLRGRWFLFSAKALTPYDEQTDEAIEQAYQRIIAQAEAKSRHGNKPKDKEELSETVSREGRNVVLTMMFREDRRLWKFSCEDRVAKSGSSWVSFGRGLFEGTYLVQRGYDLKVQPGEAEEEHLESEIGNVIVLVHGIGEKMWSEEGCGLAWSSGIFRQLVHAKQLRSAGYVESGDKWEYKGEGAVPKLKKDEVLEASWWETIHTDAMDGRLARISLPTMKQVRQIANFTVVDALYYMHPEHQQKILDAVAKSVNSALARFYQHHPNHQGPVVLAGHSLGGVILFELLRRGHSLSCTPQVLFTMGSPVGLFMHTSDKIPNRSYTLPEGTRYFNIFHPMDPVAYRIEPLIAEELEALDAERIPADGNWGGIKANHALQKMGKTITSWASRVVGDPEETSESDLLRLIGGVALNAGDRIDWALQEDHSIWTGAGVVGELMQALPSHACYMKSADVAAFIQSRSTAIAVANSLAVKASRAPETVTLNIPKETTGAEKDDKDPKDLVSRPEQ